MKLCGQAASCRPEKLKGPDDLGQGEGGEAKEPTVPGRNVHQQQPITVPPKGHAVSVDYVHVNFVKVPATLANGSTGRWIVNCGEVPQGRRKLARVEELGVG